MTQPPAPRLAVVPSCCDTWHRKSVSDHSFIRRYAMTHAETAATSDKAILPVAIFRLIYRSHSRISR